MPASTSATTIAGMVSMPPRSVLVVDDEPLMLELICRSLDEAGFLALPTKNASEALKLFRTNNPDVAVIDVNLGAGPNGVMLASSFRREDPYVPIVLLTVKVDPRAVDGPVLPSDVHFLNKASLSDVHEFLRVVDAAARGQGGVTRHDRTSKNPLKGLSNAQVEVLRLIADGLTNEQIAKARGTSLRAAELLVSRTFTRVGIDSGSGNRRVLAARKLV